MLGYWWIKNDDKYCFSQIRSRHTEFGIRTCYGDACEYVIPSILWDMVQIGTAYKKNQYRKNRW
jgi:hypothetical protein